jgi:hypothetical protein
MSLAFGVGQVFSADAVGHNEESLSFVRGSNVGRSNGVTVDAVTVPFEITDNAVQSVRNEASNILDEDNFRPRFADEAGVFAPETALGSVDSFSSSGDRNIRAREPAAKHVNWRERVAIRMMHILNAAVRVRPMLRENGTTERIDLHLEKCLSEPSKLKP